MLMLGALFRFGLVAAWVVHIIACMGGCLGCDKPKLTSSVYDTFKERNNHIRKTSKSALSEDLWTTSPHGMDNNALQSHGSMSSTSTLTQVHDADGAGCLSKQSEFVNHGFLFWNQIRQKWTENKRPERRAELLEPKLSWNATHNSVLGSNKPFQSPIPLAEMVDFLVDVWEQDGL